MKIVIAAAMYSSTKLEAVDCRGCSFFGAVPVE